MSNNSILLTRFQGRNNDLLTKRFFIDNDGNIRKKSTPNFQRGVAEQHQLSSLSEIETLINGLRPNECVSTGIYTEELVDVLPEAKLDEVALKRGCRSRSKKFMAQPERGLVMLDYDPNPDLPAALQFKEPADLMRTLEDVIPELKNVGYSGTTSCSAGIYKTDDKVPVNDAVGLHLYLVLEGTDLERLKHCLEVKLWNASLGFIAYAKNGARLQRTILDLSVLSPERLIFEARPVLGAGVSQSPRAWTHREGGALRVFTITPEEEAQAAQLIATAKGDEVTIAKSDEAYERYRAGKIDELIELKGIDRVEAEQSIPQLPREEREKQDATLPPEHVLTIAGRQLTVAELVQGWTEYDNTAMPDPIEGPSYGLTTAKFYGNNGEQPCIHSFAHGMKTVYWLRERQDSLPDPITNRPGSATPATTAVNESNDARTPDADPLALLQTKFALLNLNGKLNVFDRERLEAPTPDGTSSSLVLSSRSDGSLLVKRAVRKWFPDLEAKDLVEDFFGSPETTCYIGVEFNPAGTTEGYLNLWQGPSLTPREGDWSLIRQFLLEVICDGVQESFDYLIRYIAHALQFPWEKPGVMLTLLGGQGTGKSTLGRLLHEIWGPSYVQVHDVHAITGNFNGSLEQAFWVFMDEALFAGDRRTTDALKSLVTEPVIQINQKHQPARQSRSYHRFITATNASHSKNTERDDRRDFVLRVSEGRKSDHVYWTALNAQITGGGAAAMMHDLLAMDLSDLNVRSKPHTKALTDQKLRSLDPIPNWWYDALQRGEVTEGMEWPTFVSTADAIEGIKELAGHRLYQNPTAADVVRTMLEMCPSAEKKQSGSKHDRKRGVALPSLEQARAEFSEYIGGPVPW